MGLKVLSFGISSVVSIFTGLFSTIKTVGSILLWLVSSPVGIVVAGVVAIGGVLLWVSGCFDGLGKIASDTFGGIADALAAGDIALAGKILWLGLKAAWRNGVHALYEVWVGFKIGFMSVWDSITGFVMQAWNTVIGAIARSIAWVINTAQKMGDSVGIDLGLSGFQGEDKKIQDETAKRAAELEKASKDAANKRNLDYSKDLAQNDKELADAKNELAAATKKAHDAREAAKDPSVAMPAGYDATDLEAGADIGAEKLKAGRDHGSDGTFSSAIAARMGGISGDPAMKIVAEGQQTNKHLDRIAKMIQRGAISPVFQ